MRAPRHPHPIANLAAPAAALFVLAVLRGFVFCLPLGGGRDTHPAVFFEHKSRSFLNFLTLPFAP